MLCSRARVIGRGYSQRIQYAVIAGPWSFVGDTGRPPQYAPYVPQESYRAPQLSVLL